VAEDQLRISWPVAIGKVLFQLMDAGPLGQIRT
jgi:hypothetical protein